MELEKLELKLELELERSMKAVTSGMEPPPTLSAKQVRLFLPWILDGNMPWVKYFEENVIKKRMELHLNTQNIKFPIDNYIDNKSTAKFLMSEKQKRVICKGQSMVAGKRKLFTWFTWLTWITK